MSNKQNRINQILDSPEFIQSLRKLDEKEREIVENSARELLKTLFDSIDSIDEAVRKRSQLNAKTVDPNIDESSVVKE